MCEYCEFGKRGKFKGRTPDFLILQDRFALKIEKDEPYVGHWHKTVVCDRCKRIIASAQCNKKPREDEVSICRTCAVEMWTKEKEARQ